MSDDTMHHPRSGFGYVRTLSQPEELPLLRDHLLRLDSASRHDRFNGFIAAKILGNGKPVSRQTVYRALGMLAT